MPVDFDYQSLEYCLCHRVIGVYEDANILYRSVSYIMRNVTLTVGQRPLKPFDQMKPKSRSKLGELIVRPSVRDLPWVIVMLSTSASGST